MTTTKKQVKKSRKRKIVAYSVTDNPIKNSIESAVRKKFHQKEEFAVFYDNGWYLRRVNGRFEYWYRVIPSDSYRSVDGFDFELIEEFEVE
jgi:hypothetical protein